MGAAATAAAGTLAVMVALQWAATFVPRERLEVALDDGAVRVEALAPRPHLGTAHRLRHHLQYMECESAALLLRGSDPDFFASRWQRTVFTPSPANAGTGELLARCRHVGDGWQIVDHYGWRFTAPPREAKRGTERWTTIARGSARLCPKESPHDPYPRAFRWEAPAECRAARLTETCAVWLYPEECSTYASAPFKAKPYKPRYWWGGTALWTLALAAAKAETVRTATTALGWIAPLVFMAVVGWRSRRAAWLLAPVAPLGWWSQWDFGLWSFETAAPQLWAWSAATVAALVAGRRRGGGGGVWMPTMGAGQAYLWLLDTAEALGFGLIALTAYAVVRGRSEKEGATEAARLAGAFAAGFVGALAAGVLLRHAVYEQTIALTHPTLSGYVLTNALEQVGARGAEGVTFMAQGLGVAGTAYFLAWIWGQLTLLSTGKALVLHAAAYLAIAAHLASYASAAWRRGGRSRPWGASVAVALAIGGLVAEVVPWNDDWVRLGRATILLPAAGWLVAASHMIPAGRHAVQAGNGSA